MSEAKLVIYYGQTADLGSKSSYIFYRGQVQAPTGRHMIDASRGLNGKMAVMSAGVRTPILLDQRDMDRYVKNANASGIWQTQVKIN